VSNPNNSPYLRHKMYQRIFIYFCKYKLNIQTYTNLYNNQAKETIS